ncbi:MAG: alpha/beta hydrolase [Clostridiales bacterium]|nr:alpha/beta hydrolase [Roseburia sp.]MDD7635734.1 alpha/beta hydrolase [Clostridiales bacterium]MDY4112261.1 alpha/beta hydrolase [Roseburia sp.]
MMLANKIKINNIPALVWGEKSDKVYLCVHGKMSSKESAETVAKIAEEKGYQAISFDLPRHGERVDEDARCDIWNGMHDLSIIADYVWENWKEVSLYACSLGAYFSLNTYGNRNIRKCLFQSPIVDMEYLIWQMMRWFDVSEERLSREKEIDTPIDTMTWDYYQYVKAHPIQEWDIPTCVLFGGKDNLQSLEVIKKFADKFHCSLTVAENSEHPFMGEGDAQIVNRWLKHNI